MADEKRRFVFMRFKAGDYLVVSNDGATLWRLRRYEDGSDYGLQVPYKCRRFWSASSMPLPSGDFMVDDLEFAPWVEQGSMFRTRHEAETFIFGRVAAELRTAKGT